MRGYRAEEWTYPQIEKAFKLPLRSDFVFRLIEKPPPYFETVVATTLPVYLSDASAPGPDHKDKLSSLAGGFKRLGAQVPSCSFNKMKKILRYSRKYIYPQFRTFTADQIVNPLQWINGINHPESRKQQLRAALQQLETTGMVSVDGENDDDLELPTTVESFIKDEKYEEEKPSRWINSSLDRVKVAFGPIADKCMERLVEHESMIKTVPVAERANAIWKDLGGEDVIAQSSDATAMEDHYANLEAGPVPGLTNDPRYRISNEFMLYLCGDIPTPVELIKAVQFSFYTTPGLKQYDNKFKREQFTNIRDSPTLRTFFKNIIDTYRTLKMRHFGYILVNAILCSGEMNTSFKNTSSMFTMTNYASYHLSEGRYPTCPCKNEGDDALAVYHGGKGPDEAWWRKYGWEVKVEFKGKVNEASFCGLVFAQEALDSVPDIRKTLSKFGWTNRRYVSSSYHCRMSLLRAKALSLACEYKNVPILGILAERLLTLTKHVHVRKSFLLSLDLYERSAFESYLKQKPWQVPPKIHPQTRLLVERLQGIPVGVQMQIEEQLSFISLSPFSLPFLEFSKPMIHNMTRCSEIKEIPRSFSQEGRDRVCFAMESKILSDVRWSRFLPSMLRQLELLRQGAI